MCDTTQIVTKRPPDLTDPYIVDTGSRKSVAPDEVPLYIRCIPMYGNQKDNSKEALCIRRALKAAMTFLMLSVLIITIVFCIGGNEHQRKLRRMRPYPITNEELLYPPLRGLLDDDTPRFIPLVNSSDDVAVSGWLSDDVISANLPVIHTAEVEKEYKTVFSLFCGWLGSALSYHP